LYHPSIQKQVILVPKRLHYTAKPIPKQTTAVRGNFDDGSLLVSEALAFDESPLLI
jgi:hypothetical protein